MSYLGEDTPFPVGPQMPGPVATFAGNYLNWIGSAFSSSEEIAANCKRGGKEGTTLEQCIYGGELDRKYGRIALGVTVGVVGLGAWLLLRRRR